MNNTGQKNEIKQKDVVHYLILDGDASDVVDECMLISLSTMYLMSCGWSKKNNNRENAHRPQSQKTKEKLKA